jgi:hypothetical protein
MKNLYILAYLIFSVSGNASMIANITQDIETEFGTYHSYIVDVTPSCAPYTIESGFTNVMNFDSFSFTGVEESLLSQNAFVATPSSYMEMYNIYNEAREHEIPIFVSCDALLHTYHKLYDKMLQTAEKEQLISDIENITDELIENTNLEWTSASDSSVKEALRLNLAYLSVAKCLLDTSFIPIPEVQTLVGSELTYIETHAGLSPSPIFSYEEDYSQYVPRGHYTLSDTLERYFRTMMWYGRITFVNDQIEPELTNFHTRMALLLIHSIYNSDIGGEPGIDIWERVYLPTVFYVGKTDDINIYQYTEIMKEIYGEDFASLPVDTFANNSLLEQFIIKADSLPGPEITTPTPKGFRLMGQRFIPDSYMFTHLTNPIDRTLPKGLDVMAVLGSDRAVEILDDVYSEPGWVFDSIASLRTEFNEKPAEAWVQTLYWNWLYCLMPFTFAKGTGFPTFMLNTAWENKELYAVLGSWTELRHNTILYAKQSYASGIFPTSPTVHGYVEPNPWFFGRLASLADYMKEGLKNLNLLYDDFEARLSGLTNLLLTLKTIAEKELTNQPITEGEDRAITGIGAEMSELISFKDNYEGHIFNGFIGEEQMPIVADVHTDLALTGCCLEEGVGYPLNLYVIVPLNGELVVTQGAGFSYYEFLQPISERLTDKAWRDMLQSAPPDVPVWVSTFLDTLELGAIAEPHNYISNGEEWETQNFSGIEEQDSSYSEADSRFYFSPLVFRTDKIKINYLVTSPETPVSLKVFDITGKLIKILLEGKVDRGHHSINWDVKDNQDKKLFQGVYFIQFEAGGLIETKKLILIR